MLPARLFSSASDSINFGALSLMSGLTQLTARIVFNLDQSQVGAFGESDPARSWVSLWDVATDAAQGFLLGQDPGDTLGKVRFSVADAAGHVVTVVSTNTVLTNLWPYPSAQRHELVGTWNATGGDLSLYLDGLLIGSATGQTAVTAMGSPTGSLCIGASPGGTNAPAALEVTECGLWALALDAGTIAAMAQEHAPSGLSNFTPDIATVYGGTRRGSFLGYWRGNIQPSGSETLKSGNIVGQPQASALATATITGTTRYDGRSDRNLESGR